MSFPHTVLLLFSVLVGLLLGLVTWGFLRIWRHAAEDTLVETRDDLLLGVLALAAFSLCAFVTYILLLSCNL